MRQILQRTRVLLTLIWKCFQAAEDPEFSTHVVSFSSSMCQMSTRDRALRRETAEETSERDVR